MVNEKQAQKIAQTFIEKMWMVPVEAKKVVFQSADNQKRRIVELSQGNDTDATQILNVCRDRWSVMFPTILKNGKALDSPTFVDVDAETGEPAFMD